MSAVHIERGQDWVKVSHEGSVIFEGHSIIPEDLLNRLGFTVTIASVDYCAWCLEGVPEGTTDQWGVCPTCRAKEKPGAAP